MEVGTPLEDMLNVGADFVCVGLVVVIVFVVLVLIGVVVVGVAGLGSRMQ